MSKDKQHAPLLLEAALLRRLITRRDLRRRRLVARLLDNGGVYVTLRDAPLGTWEWSGDMFVFRRAGKTEPSFTAYTLLGAAAYVATLVD